MPGARRSSTYRNVDHLEPEGVADQVVGQDDGALQARVGPSVAVGIGNVQLGDGDGVDFVARLGHGALDHLLVLVGQDRGHCGGLCTPCCSLDVHVGCVWFGGGGWEGLSAAVGRWRVRFSGGVVLAQCLGST